MSKIPKLRNALVAENLDAVLITSPINRRYISGFTGSAGVIVISKDDARFITDFRYIEQANEQMPDFKIVEHKEGLEREIDKQLQDMNVKQLGFEKEYTSYATFESYQESFSANLVPISGLIEELRIKKTSDELEIMKQAGKIADDAFMHILDFIKPGVKEIDVSNELEFFMRKQGATSSSFDTIVASGFRSALPHGVASTKEIKSGELVTLDFGALFNGYCSDITRTVAVGNISNDLREIYDIVLDANKRGVDQIKPGMTGIDADATTRDYIESKGYGAYFGHSTGHGLGMEVHEAPRLSTNSERKLEPGMVVTVEPGIYLPGVGGCRIEDDIVITENGNERLTYSNKEFIQL